MGTAQEIIKKHIGNPAGLLAVLDDMVYRLAAHQLAKNLLGIYQRELAAVEAIDDKEVRRFAVTETERLQVLANELLAITGPSRAELNDIVAARYMVNPDRSRNG